MRQVAKSNPESRRGEITVGVAHGAPCGRRGADSGAHASGCCPGSALVAAARLRPLVGAAGGARGSGRSLLRPGASSPRPPSLGGGLLRGRAFLLGRWRSSVGGLLGRGSVLRWRVSSLPEPSSLGQPSSLGSRPRRAPSCCRGLLRGGLPGRSRVRLLRGGRGLLRASPSRPSPPRLCDPALPRRRSCAPGVSRTVPRAARRDGRPSASLQLGQDLGGDVGIREHGLHVVAVLERVDDAEHLCGRPSASSSTCMVRHATASAESCRCPAACRAVRTAHGPLASPDRSRRTPRGR